MLYDHYFITNDHLMNHETLSILLCILQHTPASLSSIIKLRVLPLFISRFTSLALLVVLCHGSLYTTWWGLTYVLFVSGGHVYDNPFLERARVGHSIYRKDSAGSPTLQRSILNLIPTTEWWWEAMVRALKTNHFSGLATLSGIRCTHCLTRQNMHIITGTMILG